jgi:hypothetical protein
MDFKITPFEAGGSYGARFAGRIRLLEREHFLVSRLPGSEPQSLKGSAYLNLAKVSFSTTDYSVSLSAQLELEENFLDVKSWPTDVSLQAKITPSFKLDEGKFKLLNVEASAKTTFLSASLSGQLLLNNPNQSRETYLRMTSDLVGSLATGGGSFLSKAGNYALDTFGLTFNFSSTVRFVGIPVTHAWGQIGKDTDLNAIGLLPVPAGTLFDVSALVVGGYKSHTGSGVDWNIQGGVLPLLTPSAISAGEAPEKMFPTYLYGKLEFNLGSLSLGPVTLGNIRTGAEASASIADLAGSKEETLTDQDRFNKMYEAVTGKGEAERAPVRASVFLIGEF